MYEIDAPFMSDDFADCCCAAKSHLQSQSHDAPLSWLKVDLNPPFLEHLSFRIGNQLFYVRVIDVDGKVTGPGNPNGYKIIAKGCNGHACLMPMRNVNLSIENKKAKWEAECWGWGLVNPATNEPIDPLALVSNEKIEMTDWEVHDFAVQVVRDHVLEKLGYELMFSQGDPKIDPSIWFAGDDGPEWIVVRAARYPKGDAPRPDNLTDIAALCSKLGKKGYFASVCFANVDDPFDPTGENSALPLWRGHGACIKFEGLHLVWKG